jgi:tRNA-Thr(GGU) m(6)t(6)A37 methyltransferase TsaA
MMHSSVMQYSYAMPKLMQLTLRVLKVTNDIQDITLSPIGIVNSPYKEKFAIPRQPGLVDAAKGTIELLGMANDINSVRGLNQFSHIWLLFIFHGTQEHGWKTLVRPPRLGGNKKIGVLATRSTFRPNPLGMSVVKLDEIEVSAQNVILHISGIDLLDKTPIVDIKPYIPYSDSLPNANAGFVQNLPHKDLSVKFSIQAQQELTKFKNEIPELTVLIEQVLAQDPRPAYKKNKADNKTYGMSLYDVNIQWIMLDFETIEVIQISKLI